MSIDSLMGTKSWEWKDVLDGTPLEDKRVRNHVSRAFTLLGMAAVVASITTYLSVSVFSSFVMTSGFRFIIGLATFGLLLATQFTHGTTKVACFAGFSAAIGASIAPLVSMAVAVDPAIVMTAVLLSVIVFASFAVIATVTSSRPMLWLGGPLASLLLGMVIVNALNSWFFRSQAFFMTVDVYFGLLLFCGFVVFDTQLLIARAKAAVDAGIDLGIDDAVRAASELFLDLVNIFVRILVILLKNANKKRREDDD